jgi:hypothetical protein
MGLSSAVVSRRAILGALHLVHPRPCHSTVCLILADTGGIHGRISSVTVGERMEGLTEGGCTQVRVTGKVFLLGLARQELSCPLLFFITQQENGCQSRRD